MTLPPSPSIGTGYTYISLTQMQVQLSERLGDSANVYWAAGELTEYIQEALRTWQSLTRYWRARMTFPVEQGQTRNTEWYDLTAQGSPLLSLNILDSDLCSTILYHLLEPQLSAGLYVGSDMFTLDAITQSLQRRRDQFLVETGMMLSEGVTAWPGVASLAPLPSDKMMDVSRAAWLNSANPAIYSVLWKSDEWYATASAPNWPQSPTDPPSEWSMATLGPLMMQLFPPPANNGLVDLLTLSAGAALNPTVGIAMGIPDNFVWVIKWGAMADLLGESGEVTDAARSAYCEQRWQEGIMAARIFSSIEMGYVNGAPGFVSSLHDLDVSIPNWQNTSGEPSTVALAGYNMLAVSPVPDNNGPYVIMLDVVQNAPVPVSGTDKVQIGREELDAVLGYALHLASFKQGGAEFMASIPFYQNFMQLALVRNQRLAAAIPSKQPLFDKALRQEQQRPRRSAELPVGIGPDNMQ